MPFRFRDLKFEEVRPGGRQGFSGALRCDSRGCPAISPESPKTWRWWRVVKLARFQAKCAGWDCWPELDLDFCPEHFVTLPQGEYDELVRRTS